MNNFFICTKCGKKVEGEPIFETPDRSMQHCRDCFLKAFEEPLLTTEDIATLLKVDVQSVRRWVQRGDLKAYKIGDKYIRVSRSDLFTFLHRTKPGDETSE